MPTSGRSISHVWGKDSYDEPRNVPIPKELHLWFRTTFSWDARLSFHKAQSDALFFATDGQYSFLSGNIIRKIKKIVEGVVGGRFELRDCCRAYGQYCLNKGIKIDGVSVLMIHETARTTELYYCRKEEDKAMETVKEVW